MFWQNLWWTVFIIALAGNVFGWAVTILRILQNLDSLFAKLCLIFHVFVPVGLVLAFTFGWTHSKKDDHLKVMILWTCAAILFAILTIWDPTEFRG